MNEQNIMQRWKQVSNYAFKLSLQQIHGPKHLLAFDIGTKFTGVAVADPNLKLGYYLQSIKKDVNSEEFYKTVQKLIISRHAHGIIIGKPNLIKQTADFDMSIVINTFLERAKQKQVTSSIMYTLVDESFTTKDARDELKEWEQQYRKWGHLHKEKELLDGMAAIKIMKKFLQYYHQT